MLRDRYGIKGSIVSMFFRSLRSYAAVFCIVGLYLGGVNSAIYADGNSIIQGYCERDSKENKLKHWRGWKCSSRLIATGQTICYDFEDPEQEIDCSGTGQDGEFQLGKKLRFVDLGDGRIQDRNTQLQWEKKSDDGGIHDVDNVYDWSGAFYEHVNTLNNTCQMDETVSCTCNADCATSVGGKCGFAGKRDWRVPNIRELITIINFELTDPDADPPIPRIADAFNKNCAEGVSVLAGSCVQNKLLPYTYWSSTTGDVAVDAYFVDFETADVGAHGKEFSLEIEQAVVLDDDGFPIYELDDEGNPVFEMETFRSFAGYVRAVRGPSN